MAKGMIDLYLSNDKDLDISNGHCVNHDDPDLWFAGEVDLPNTNSSVNTNSKAAQAEVSKAIVALSICKGCPAKNNCLEIGMRGHQLYFGIYGGTMAGERLLTAGRSMKNSANKQKLGFARKVRRTMKERGISGNQTV
jgi:hypothetical protein